MVKIRKKDLSEATLFGIGVFGSEKNVLLENILKRGVSGSSSDLLWINTPNSEQMVMASGNDVFRSSLNASNIRVPDGVSLVWSSKILKFFGKIDNSIKERISGVDLIDEICAIAEKNSLPVYLLGGMGVVSEFAAQKLKTKYSKLKTSYSAGTENIKDLSDEENEKILADIEESKAEVLFVGFGAPWQEMWVDKNRKMLNKMGVKLVMVVGGAYDMISGNISRAPEWMRKAGFEWLWRLIQEPWRWKRQLSLFKYWGMVGRLVLRIED